jgi:hypothetical protein
MFYFYFNYYKMAGTSITSLKSVITSRVDLGQVDRQYSSSRALGHPDTCPISAMNPDVDQNGRPLGGSGYRLQYMDDPACSMFVYPLAKKLRHENAERPNLGPCMFGDRGGGDFLAYHRDDNPIDIYGFGTRGNFVSTAPVDEGSPYYDAQSQPMKPNSLSMDAIQQKLRS